MTGCTQSRWVEESLLPQPALQAPMARGYCMHAVLLHTGARQFKKGALGPMAFASMESSAPVLGMTVFRVPRWARAHI